MSGAGPASRLTISIAWCARWQEAWETGHSTDQLILNAGRTWRLGDEPEYLAIWHTNAGLERLDEWTEAFRARGNVGDEATMSRVARIDVAGCYDALLPPVRARDSVYYVEKFATQATREETQNFFQARARRHASLRLNLAAIRIGKLGPDPGGLAVWSLPNFAALSEIASELDACHAPVRLVSAGVYADIGKEIL